MRTIEEIKRDFESTTDEKLREKLRDEYVKLLPDREHVAITHFSLFCTDKTKIEKFNSGVHGLEDDWNEPIHQEYLVKADKSLEIYEGDCGETIKSLLQCYAMGYREA